ncbi:MAG: pyruvate, phosphate dikinase, partial [Acidobacteria bacterium]|nr:pyruvate, phosphate dikinase [Acidobacteriota bacterium]
MPQSPKLSVCQAGLTNTHVHLFPSRTPTLELGKELLGGKGAGLFEMAAIGMPVPPGFVIDTRVCSLQRDAHQSMLAQVSAEIADGVAHIEHSTGKRFGSRTHPLLVSVRSGARESMPGMMDTILNLGVNDDTVIGLADASGDERFAWDSYRRLIQMYSNIVFGIAADLFERALEKTKSGAGVSSDSELDVAALRELTARYKAIVLDCTGLTFPQDPQEQLTPAIAAVFESWNSARACAYRRLNEIPNDWGTAVTVQAMVFGNLGRNSATGVAFTRNPATGEHKLYGEYLANAQGEDVVAGIRTPLKLTCDGNQDVDGIDTSLEAVMPEAFKELLATAERLERHYGDVQDIEFTIEREKLFILQTRS